MKIKMNDTLATPTRTYDRGQVYEVPDDYGQSLLDGGLASGTDEDENAAPQKVEEVFFGPPMKRSGRRGVPSCADTTHPFPEGLTARPDVRTA